MALFSMFSYCKKDMEDFFKEKIICFLIAKGIEGARIYFGFYIVFYYNKRIKNVTKKKFNFHVVCFLVAIGLGGATIFLCVFLLCFLAITRVGGEKKILFMFLSILVTNLIIFLYTNVRFVTTWLLGRNIIYTKLGKEAQKEL